MTLGRVSLAVRSFGIILLASLAVGASAQDLSGDAGNTRPTIASTRRGQGTAFIPKTGGTEVGQRLEKKDVMPNLEPMHRINSRIENRVENRISNRIDRDQDANTGSTVAYTIATTRVRKAANPLRVNTQKR